MKARVQTTVLERYPDWMRLVMGLVIALVCTARPASADDEPLAKVSGGSDDSGHRYTWTVSNQHSSPIVSVEFPHYHADLFVVPPGWSDEGTTNIVGRGGGDKVGVCKATVTSPRDGIAPRGQATFEMNIAAAGAHKGVGSVRIQFADGSGLDVAGVEIPVPEPALPRYARLAGFATLFGLFLLWASMRGRSQGHDEGLDTPKSV